jgi:hypothetical protein
MTTTTTDPGTPTAALNPTSATSPSIPGGAPEPAREYRFSFEASTNAKGQVQLSLKVRGDVMADVIDALKQADEQFRVFYGTRLAGA